MATLGGYAQSESDLAIRNIVTVSGQQGRMFLGDAKCDDEGNVYFQPYVPNQAYTVFRVDKEGHSTFAFANPALKTSIWEYVPDSGGIFALTGEIGSTAIIKLGADGSVEDKIPLDGNFFPGRLALFRSGEFLITGSLRRGSGSEESLNEFAAISTADGKLRHLVRFPAGDRELSKTDRNLLQQEGRDEESVLGLSYPLGSPDGYVYFMRATPSGPIYRVNPRGVIDKTYKLRPPKDFSLSDFRTSRGRLLAIFTKKPDPQEKNRITPMVIQELDSATSEVLRTFHHRSAQIGLLLACYDPNEGFTFLGTSDAGLLQLVHVVPK